jgi:hypothetical protein
LEDHSTAHCRRSTFPVEKMGAMNLSGAELENPSRALRSTAIPTHSSQLTHPDILGYIYPQARLCQAAITLGQNSTRTGGQI